MERELFIINRDEGSEIIVFDPKSNSAVIRLGREIKLCDEALIVRIKKDIETPYPYHTTVKKVVSSIATSYWRTVIAGLLQAKKTEKELETAKVRALKHFNEILFRCAPEIEEVSKER